MSEGEYSEMKRDLEELLEIARKVLGKYGAKIESVDFEYVESITESRLLGAMVSLPHGVRLVIGGIVKEERRNREIEAGRNPGWDLHDGVASYVEHAEHDGRQGREMPEPLFLLHDWDDGWGQRLEDYLGRVAQLSEMQILGNRGGEGMIRLSFWPPGERHAHGGKGRKQAVTFHEELIDSVEPKEIAEQLEWTWNNLELIPRGVFVSGREVNLNYLCGEC